MEGKRHSKVLRPVSNRPSRGRLDDPEPSGEIEAKADHGNPLLNPRLPCRARLQSHVLNVVIGDSVDQQEEWIDARLFRQL
jgi:hypothetical protein